jgi:hypothetical protein
VILELVGVVTDGTLPAGTIPQKVPTRRDIELPRGEDLTINLSIVGQNGAAISLAAGSPVIKLGIRQFGDDVAAKLTKTATITEPAANGKAQILIASAETLTAPALLEQVRYLYDIQLTISAKRWQVVPVSHFKILPIVNRPSD